MQHSALDAPIIIEAHPSLTRPMRRDMEVVIRTPLKRWERWNRAIGDDPASNGNCHHAAAALLLDLIAASHAQGWRVATGMVSFPGSKAPIAHSWLESPSGAALDASQVYRTRTAYAASRDQWFREFKVRPLVSRSPGQIARAVRKFGFVAAALLPISQLVDSGLLDLL